MKVPLIPLRRWQQGLVLLIALVSMGIVAYLDYITGNEIQLSLFYLLPIILMVWFSKRLYWIITCVLGSILWLAADCLSGHYYQNTAIALWNTGMILGFFLIIAFSLSKLKKDLIGEKKSNLRLLRAYEEIKKLSQVKTDFVAVVTHELKTPLVAVKEGIHIVRDKSTGPLNEEQTKYLDLAKRNLDRLAKLIDEVLDFARLEAKKKEIHDIQKFHQYPCGRYCDILPFHRREKRIEIDLRFGWSDLRHVF